MRLRFRNKELEKWCWVAAKAATEQLFEKSKLRIRALNNEAAEWLENIGWEKLALSEGLVCRFGTLTSNNVESVNSRFLSFRSLPIVEMLIGVESTVSRDRYSDWCSSEKLREARCQFTDYASKQLKKHVKQAMLGIIYVKHAISL